MNTMTKQEVLKAVKQDRWALRFASDALQDDKDIINLI